MEEDDDRVAMPRYNRGIPEALNRQDSQVQRFSHSFCCFDPVPNGCVFNMLQNKIKIFHFGQNPPPSLFQHALDSRKPRSKPPSPSSRQITSHQPMTLSGCAFHLIKELSP